MRAILFVLLLVGCSSPQQRMKDCNAEAAGLTGDARQAFMRGCLRNPGLS